MRDLIGEDLMSLKSKSRLDSGLLEEIRYGLQSNFVLKVKKITG